MKNKIGWCDMTWNPVWGCLNVRKCPYCYARIFAKRFYRKTAKIEYKDYVCSPSGEDGDPYDVMGWIDDLGERLKHFIPTFLDAKFNKKFPQKTQKIFVGSMSEIYYWEKGWIEKVIEKVKQYPQHIFIFLSKFPLAYYRNNFPQNCWLGLTIFRTPKYGEKDRWSFIEFKRNNLHNLKFVCFEPLLEDIDLSHYLNLTAISWVIIGAETGNRKEKVVPKIEWIDTIVDYCRGTGIPIYLKDSLNSIFPYEIKEFPK